MKTQPTQLGELQFLALQLTHAPGLHSRSYLLNEASIYGIPNPERFVDDCIAHDVFRRSDSYSTDLLFGYGLGHIAPLPEFIVSTPRIGNYGISEEDMARHQRFMDFESTRCRLANDPAAVGRAKMSFFKCGLRSGIAPKDYELSLLFQRIMNASERVRCFTATLAAAQGRNYDVYESCQDAVTFGGVFLSGSAGLELQEASGLGALHLLVDRSTPMEEMRGALKTDSNLRDILRLLYAGPQNRMTAVIKVPPAATYAEGLRQVSNYLHDHHGPQGLGIDELGQGDIARPSFVSWDPLASLGPMLG
ncbi:hypothetical protein [Hymenobacter antarcticus]|uniref:Uncharacterized protein n=1 Tax=Hymenobacter antarcticus TaxID=486270 RepID=A0ABP7PQU2_9BACT